MSVHRVSSKNTDGFAASVSTSRPQKPTAFSTKRGRLRKAAHTSLSRPLQTRNRDNTVITQRPLTARSARDLPLGIPTTKPRGGRNPCLDLRFELPKVYIFLGLVVAQFEFESSKSAMMSSISQRLFVTPVNRFLGSWARP